nr:unnamed protein product [Spirometra erinaceieuropaei]
MEEEENNQMAFLDVLVCRKDCGELKTKVFRKATNTMQVLNFNSNHPISHKRSCVRTLYRRVETHCSEPEDKVAELQYLRRVFKANGYPRNFVDRCIRKRDERPNRTDTKSWRALPYVKNVSEAVGRLLAPLGVGVAPTPEATIRRLVMKPKDPLPRLETSGVVYRIWCSCGQSNYVGETRRQLRTRMAEHAAAVRRNDANSQVAAHSTRSGDTFKFDEAEIRARGDNRVSRELLESWFTGPQSINKCNDLPIPYCVLKLRLGGVTSHAGSAEVNTFPDTGVAVVFVLLVVSIFILDRAAFYFAKLMERFRGDGDSNARTRNLGLTIPSLVVQFIRTPTILNSIKFARYLGSFSVITSVMTLFILSMCTILVFSVFQSTAQYPLGTIDRFYKLLRCYTERVPSPYGHPLSTGEHTSVIVAILSSVVVWSEFLVNQANWSVGIALTPNQSSVGFILTSFAIFSIPFIFSTCLGLGYLALSSAFGYDIIEKAHYKNDLMPFVVPMFLFGRQGVVIAYVLIAILTAVSCSRNIVGICTLIVYDVFGIYIKKSLIAHAVNTRTGIDNNDAETRSLLAKKNRLHKTYNDCRTDLNKTATFRCLRLMHQRLWEMQDVRMDRKAKEIQDYRDRNETKNFFTFNETVYDLGNRAAAQL